MTSQEERAHRIAGEAFTTAGQASCGAYIKGGNELTPDQPIWIAAMLALAAEVREDAAKVAEKLEAEGDYPRLHGARVAAAIRAQGGGRQ